MADITFEEAVERAREFLAWHIDHVGRSQADLQRFLYHYGGDEDFDDVEDPDARIDIAIHHLQNGGDLSPKLRAFVADKLEEVKSSQTGTKYSSRDMAILTAVVLLARDGFKPTRNKDKGGQACAEGGSACDAIGDALGMGYSNIERIWTEREPKAQWDAVLGPVPIK